MAWLRERAVVAIGPVLAHQRPGPSAPEVVDFLISTVFAVGDFTRFQPSNGRLVATNMLDGARLMHGDPGVGDPLLSGSHSNVRWIAGACRANLTKNERPTGCLALVPPGGTNDDRRGSGALMRARRLLLFLVAIVVVACGPDAAHYTAVLDDLHIPAAWQLAHTTVEAPGAEIDCTPLWGTGGCPSVARIYLVAGKPVAAYPEAKQMLVSAGFTLDLDSGPTCDVPPSGPACVLFGVRGSDRVLVSLYNPGEGPSGLGIAANDRVIVSVTAEGK